MLRRVSLKNLKLFHEIGVTVEMEKITVLIGANGTGTRSVLRGLAVFKQSLGRAQLLLSGSSINPGAGKEIIHGQDKQ